MILGFTLIGVVMAAGGFAAGVAMAAWVDRQFERDWSRPLAASKRQRRGLARAARGGRSPGP